MTISGSPPPRLVSLRLCTRHSTPGAGALHANSTFRLHKFLFGPRKFGAETPNSGLRAFSGPWAAHSVRTAMRAA